jgi:hypothetical protein
MTYEKQDIVEDFYSGNDKTIRVTIYNKDGSLKDLTGAELTYVVFRRETNEVLLRKSSFKGEDEIKVTGLGLCEIYLRGADTLHIHGTFRHHLNVVDGNEKEATAFTGMIKFHQSPASRFRTLGRNAYLEGIAE